MTERSVKVFSKFDDFNDTSVDKGKLAALCVVTKKVIEAYEKEAICIQEGMANTSIIELKKFKESLQAIIDVRLGSIKRILDEVHKKRDERNINHKLPQFTKSVDVFNNVTDEASLDNERFHELKQLNEKLIDQLGTANETFIAFKRTNEGIKIENLQLNMIIKDLEKKLNLGGRVISIKTQMDDTKMSGEDSRETTRNFSNKLDPQTPKFLGKDDDVENWIFKVELSLKVSKFPKNEWLERMANYVLGDGSDILKASIMNHESWEDFKSKMITRFKPAFKDFKLQQQFNQLKDQGNFLLYLNKFRNLAIQIPTTVIPEPQRLNIFINGCRPKIQADIFSRKITTLEQAIELATTLEVIANTSSIRDEDFNSNVNVVCLGNDGQKGKSSKRNRYPYEDDRSNQNINESSNDEEDEDMHQESQEEEENETQSETDNSKNKRSFRCWYCNKLGHLRYECKRRMREEATQVNNFDIKNENDNDEEEPADLKMVRRYHQINMFQIIEPKLNIEPEFLEKLPLTYSGEYDNSKAIIENSHKSFKGTNEIGKDSISTLEKLCIDRSWHLPIYKTLSKRVYNDNFLKHIVSLTINNVTSTSNIPYKSINQAMTAAASDYLKLMERAA